MFSGMLVNIQRPTCTGMVWVGHTWVGHTGSYTRSGFTAVLLLFNCQRFIFVTVQLLAFVSKHL
jgi:hypothetical protein